MEPFFVTLIVLGQIAFYGFVLRLFVRHYRHLVRMAPVHAMHRSQFAFTLAALLGLTVFALSYNVPVLAENRFDLGDLLMPLPWIGGAWLFLTGAFSARFFHQLQRN